MTLIDSGLFYSLTNSIGFFCFLALLLWTVRFAANMD